MRRQVIGFLVGASALVTAALPTAAQSPADVSASESSRSSGPLCVVGGTASDCGGGEAGIFPIAVGVAPVVVVPSVGIAVGSPPLVGGIFGDAAGGTVSESVDVDRSNRGGIAAAR